VQQTQRGVSWVGCGSARPATQLSNADLSRVVETSDEWITTRTGIQQRYLAQGTESLSSLAAAAGKSALAMAEIDPGDVDLIILATSTPR
jgi:3-oxoacyl-[acyl-carrier-protein] synthase-3